MDVGSAKTETTVILVKQTGRQVKMILNWRRKKTDKAEKEKDMAEKVTGMGTIFIDGFALLRLIDAVASGDLPVDQKWKDGLLYAKRLVRNMMEVEQEKE